MSYVETEEQRMLRKQVGDIGRKYGREYYNEKARNGLSPDELWDEVAKQGFIGVNTPEEYGGGGLGIYELARTLRIAPVSREMILNFIAQHSLELPKSY